MTIVCATRFTEESTRAVSVAAELAKAHQEPLHLVHVLPGGLTRPFTEKMVAAAQLTLEAEAMALGATGVRTHVTVLHGNVERSLSDFCREQKARLLVVGDTARPVSRVLADTFDKLSYSVETPMLVVRDPRPLIAWAQGSARLKAMLAFDRTESSQVARDWIYRLAEFGPIDLLATQVWWPYEEYERRGLPVPPPEEGHRALSTKMKEETVAAVQHLHTNVRGRVRLEMGVGHVAEHLMEIATEEQVDLMVVGTHRRRAFGRLWSVSHQVLAQAPMAVACVPTSRESAAAVESTSTPVFTTALAVTDLTPGGNRSVTTALGVVGRGTVHVVLMTPEPFSSETEAKLVQRVGASLPSDVERNGARVQVHVLHGDPLKELPMACAQLGAQVVCLGSGAAEAEGLVEAVLAHAKRPVLLAPPS